MSEGEVGAALAPSELIAKLVYDVNGHRLGRVTRCMEKDGRLTSFDVALDRKAMRDFDAEAEVLRLPSTLILATDFQVSLAEDGAHLVHPERAAPPSRE